MRRISAVLPKCLLLLGICSMFIGMSWAADKDDSDIAKRIDASANVLNEIMARASLLAVQDRAGALRPQSPLPVEVLACSWVVRQSMW